LLGNDGGHAVGSYREVNPALGKAIDNRWVHQPVRDVRRHAQRVPPHILSSQPDVARDLVGGEVHRLRNGLALKPYEVPWLDCRMARVRRCNRARLPIDFCQLLRLLLRSIRAAEAKRSLRHEAR